MSHLFSFPQIPMVDGGCTRKTFILFFPTDLQSSFTHSQKENQTKNTQKVTH